MEFSVIILKRKILWMLLTTENIYLLYGVYMEY